MSHAEANRAWMLARLYERRDSLKRVLELKKRLRMDTALIESLSEANRQDIDLWENGSGLSHGTEAAVDAGFIQMNGL